MNHSNDESPKTMGLGYNKKRLSKFFLNDFEKFMEYYFCNKIISNIKKYFQPS